MRLTDALGALSNSGTCSPGTIARYRLTIRGLEAAGITATEQCDVATVARFLDERLVNVKAKTANLDLVAIVSTLRYAARREPDLLPRIAAIGALRLRVPCPPPPEVYSPDDWRLIRAAAASIAPWLPLALDLTTYAGLRRNEARTIHAEDIELEERVLLVVRRKERELKTRVRSQRAVSLCPELLAALKSYDLPERGPLFPARSCTARTIYVSMETWKRAMARLQRETGLRPTYGRGRRSFVTWAIRSGVPQVDVQKMAGHADGRQIEQHYYGWRTGYNPAIEKLKPSG